MTRYTFTARRHAVTGALGWLADFAQGVDPYDGGAVAHDILEHAMPFDGSFAQEMIAWGGMLFVRFTSKGTREAGKEYRHFDGKAAKWWRNQQPGRPVVLLAKSKPLPPWAEREVRAAIDRICPRYPAYVASLWRMGFNAAERRFGNQELAWALFQQIEAEADRMLAEVSEGDRIEIELNDCYDFLPEVQFGVS